MARIRKSEPSITVSAAGAAPARRKTATATATPKSAASSPKPGPAAATESEAAIVEAVEVPYSPTQEKIAELAYSYWVSRGCQGGSPEEDWLRAEMELIQPA
jgi:Protein of unknown function (DUF2934)